MTNGLTPPAMDFSIGRGDNAPVLTWVMPFAVAESDIVLTIVMPRTVSSEPSLAMTLTVSDGQLVLDSTANTVTWSVTAAQSSALQPTNFYKLRRIVPNGEIRYYAHGRIFGVDGPVGSTDVVVTDAGPQGVPGSSAYQSYVTNGGTLTEAQWSSPNNPLPIATEADAVAGVRSDVAITPATLQAAIAFYLAQNPTIPITPPVVGAPSLDFSDPANSGLLAALGFFGAPFTLTAPSSLDFSNPSSSGLIVALGA